MKKHSILLPFLLCGVVACNSNDSPIPNPTFYGELGQLNGNVVSVKTSGYEADEKFGEAIAGELLQVTIEEYDNHGNLVKMARYDDDGDCFYRLDRVFENNKLVSIREIADNKETAYNITYTKDYVEWSCTEGVAKNTVLRKYYEGLTEKVKNTDGVVLVETIFDKKGYVLKQKQYNENGELLLQTMNEYDKDGNKIKEAVKDNSGASEELVYTLVDYDKKHNWLTMYARNKNGDILAVGKREITYR